MLLPSYGEDAADMFDVSKDHTVVREYCHTSYYNTHKSVEENVIEVIHVANKIVCFIRQDYRSGFVERQHEI